MQEQDFFRSRIDAMINLNDPLRRVSSYLSPHSCGQPLNIVASQMRLDDAVTFGV